MAEAEQETVQVKQVKGRKNGLYAGVSEELEQNMRSGWADTEREGLDPSGQTPYAAKRRETLSAAFPGERLVIPSGRLKVRANDTDYAFRASSDYVYLTGDQTENSVLILEPNADGHDATVYLLPRSNREDGEFWQSGQGELWVGRRASLAEAAVVLGLETRDSRQAADQLAEALAADPSVLTRILTGHDEQLDAVVALARQGSDGEAAAERDEELVGLPARHAPDQGRMGDRAAAQACDATARASPSRARAAGVRDRRPRRALDRGHVLAARPARGQRRRLRLDRRDRRRTRPRCTGCATTAGCSPATSRCSTWASRSTASTPPTSPAPCRSTAAFRDVQRQVYDAVLAAQQAGIDATKPGADFLDPHRAAWRCIAEPCEDWGILVPVSAAESLQEDARPAPALHAAQHLAHARARRARLRNAPATETYQRGAAGRGMVLTVEPGLYFQPDDETVPAGVPRHRRAHRGRRPRHGDRQREPLRRPAAHDRGDRALDGRPRGLSRIRSAPVTGGEFRISAPPREPAQPGQLREQFADRA